MKVGGGGEFVSMNIAMALKDIGYRVVVLHEAIRLPFHLLRVANGIEMRLVPWYRLPFDISHVLSILLGLALRIRYRRSLLIDSLGLLLGPTVADLAYVHYPGLRDLGLHRARVLRRLRSLAFIPIGLVFKFTLIRKQLILFNSHWSKNASLAAAPLYGRLAIANPILHVLYPPVDISPLLEVGFESRNRSTILTLSRYDRVKRLEAVVPLAKATPEMKFVIAGAISDKGYLEELEGRISAEGLESRISLVSDFSQQEKIELISNSCVLVHFSRNEHFGIALAEGLAGGLTVVAYDFGGAKEFLPSETLYRDDFDLPHLVKLAASEWSQKVASGNRAISRQFDENEFRNGVKKALEGLRG